MKKLFRLFASLILVFVLTACGGGAVLQDTAHDYYVTGNFAGWGDAPGKAEFKMTPIALNDSRISSIRSQLNGATGLYVVEIVLPSAEADWDVTYTIAGTERKFNGNLTIKVIQTDAGDNIPNYWAQSPESGAIENLTPNTLYVPPFVEENIGGAGGWNDNPVAIGGAGNYLLVFAVFPQGRKAMGLLTR